VRAAANWAASAHWASDSLRADRLLRAKRPAGLYGAESKLSKLTNPRPIEGPFRLRARPGGTAPLLATGRAHSRPSARAPIDLAAQFKRCNNFLLVPVDGQEVAGPIGHE